MNVENTSPTFNGQSSTNRKSVQGGKNYNHHELLHNINKYEGFIKSKEDLNGLKQLKKDYLKREGAKHITRAKRDKNFLLGARTGISPDKNLSSMHTMDKEIDRAHRQKLGKKVKILYRKNFNIIKRFNQKTKLKNEAKLKDINFPKIAELKIPHKVVGKDNKALKSKRYEIVDRFKISSGIEKHKTKAIAQQKNYALRKRFAMSNKVKDRAITKEM